MASIDTTRPFVAVPRFSLARIATTLFHNLQTWNDARATRATLSRLSEHELRDIGLSRNEIEYIGRR
ncbi:MAG: DUF1127 domain-containing protein [Rubellimicrobium sp.]|nr:DUF1127 domain-containing protein [Rubellimicrobium sp.]